MSGWTEAGRVDTEADPKTCTACHVEKPLEDYPTKKSHGRRVHIARCRECERARVRPFAAAHKAKALASATSRAEVRRIREGQHVAIMRAFGIHIRREEQAARASSEREETKERAARRAELRRMSWDPNTRRPGMTPEQARHKVANAVALGHLPYPGRCEDCSAEANGYDLNAHHDDYEYPLRVRWLCVPCHVAEHDGEWGAAGHTWSRSA